MRPSVQLGRRLMELDAAVVIAIGAGLVILPSSPLHVIPAQKDTYPVAAVDRC